MKQLASRDLAEILEVGRITLSCESQTELQTTSLKLLEKALSARSSLYFDISRDNSSWRFGHGLSRGVPEQGPELWHQHYYKQDPFVQAFLDAPGSKPPVVVSSQILSHKKLIATEFYADFLEPQSIYHILILGLVSSKGPIGLFGFHRPLDAAPFSKRDAEKACLLSPYLSAAVENTKRKEESRCFREAIDQMAYDSANRGVIILDRSNRPLYSNLRTAELLRPDSASDDSKNQWTESIPDYITKFSTQVRSREKLSPDDLAPHCYRFDTPAKALSVEVRECRDGVQVVYVSQDDCSNIRPDRLEKFGLTNRQRAIVHLLSTGMTNPEIADKLCISIRTVQNHLRSIYDKVDVHNRTSLVNRLSH